jgi:hypothetical protein
MWAVQFLFVLPCVFEAGRPFLFAPAKKRNQGVSEIFPSLQILGHPNVPLGKSFVYEVRDVALARTG